MLIVGGGAIGTLFAADARRRLGQTTRVLLATRTKPQYEGLVKVIDKISTDLGSFKEAPIEVRALCDIRDTRFNVTLLACKQFDLYSCSSQLALLGISSTTCVTLSNGLECAEEVARGKFDASEIIPAVTYAGAKLIQPGIVERTGLGNLVLVKPKNSTDADMIRNAFPQVTFCSSAEEYERQIWKKLLANCVINPLTAILDCKNGQVPILAPYLMSLLCDEFIEACPYELDFNGLTPIQFVNQVCERTAANTSSMLADVKKRRKTEIDSLNGALLRKSKEKGLVLQTHSAIYEAIKSLERGYL